MLNYKQVVEPQYFRQFQCLATACRDNCCIGWDVVIDQTTYESYQQCQDVQLKPLFNKHVKLNTESFGETAYVPFALIQMNQHGCPFLTGERLCGIEKILGKEALSITCASYPRIFNVVDGMLERSLCVSCPEAARLVLLDKNSMHLNSCETTAFVRNDQIPLLSTGDQGSGDKPYRHFHEIRAFVINLLQDGTYPLWQRLIILSVFCNRIDQVTAEHYDEDIPYYVTYFTRKIREDAFRESMEHAGDQSALQLQAMKILIDHRLQGAAVSERFRTCVNQFLQGLGYTDGVSAAVANERYTTAYNLYYQPFMAEHEYILENYLVNYVFKNLFPFGPQKSIYFKPKSIYQEYCLLVIHYALIKTLLIGIAGCHQSNFGSEQIVTLIQTFAKAIEHNPAYLQQALEFFAINNMNNTGGMAILIKNQLQEAAVCC